MTICFRSVHVASAIVALLFLGAGCSNGDRLADQDRLIQELRSEISILQAKNAELQRANIEVRQKFLVVCQDELDKLNKMLNTRMNYLGCLGGSMDTCWSDHSFIKIWHEMRDGDTRAYLKDCIDKKMDLIK